MRKRTPKLSDISKLEKQEIRMRRKSNRDSLKESLQQTKQFLQSDDITNEQRQYASKFEKDLERSISDSYASKKGGYNTSIDKMENRARFAKDVLLVGFDEKELRKEKMFERDLAQARVEGVSTKEDYEVSTFYAATENIWRGSNPTERNIKLKEAFGVSSISEVWDIVMKDENVKEALKKAEKAREKVRSDSDVSDGSEEPADEKGSPPYMKELILSVDTQRKYRLKNG